MTTVKNLEERLFNAIKNLDANVLYDLWNDLYFEEPVYLMKNLNEVLEDYDAGEVARMINNGSFNYNDHYFIINVNGNGSEYLESSNDIYDFVDVECLVDRIIGDEIVDEIVKKYHLDLNIENKKSSKVVIDCMNISIHEAVEALRPSVRVAVWKMSDDEKIELWNSILRSYDSINGYIYHLTDEEINEYFKGLTPREILTSLGEDFNVYDRYFGNNPSDYNLGLISSDDLSDLLEDDLLVENIVMELPLDKILNILGIKTEDLKNEN